MRISRIKQWRIGIANFCSMSCAMSDGTHSSMPISRAIQNSGGFRAAQIARDLRIHVRIASLQVVSSHTVSGIDIIGFATSSNRAPMTAL